MSMSTSVEGVRDISEDSVFHRMIQVKVACDFAGISYPQEVYKYFIGDDPNRSVSNLTECRSYVDIDSAVKDYCEDCRNIWEVELAKLPVGLKSIRFINSY